MHTVVRRFKIIYKNIFIYIWVGEVYTYSIYSAEGTYTFPHGTINTIICLVMFSLIRRNYIVKIKYGRLSQAPLFYLESLFLRIFTLLFNVVLYNNKPIFKKV